MFNCDFTNKSSVPKHDVHVYNKEITSTSLERKRRRFHYTDVIMSTMTSQTTSVSIVCSTVCSGTDQRKHQSSASLAFVRGIHRLSQRASNAEDADVIMIFFFRWSQRWKLRRNDESVVTGFLCSEAIQSFDPQSNSAGLGDLTEFQTIFKYSPTVRNAQWRYDDVIMSLMASQITSLTIVYSTVYSGADQRKH